MARHPVSGRVFSEKRAVVRRRYCVCSGKGWMFGVHFILPTSLNAT